MVEGTLGSHHKGGSTKMAKCTTICAGIDTGKRKLDVALDGTLLQLQVENTAEGHKVLLEWLRHHKVKRIGIEGAAGMEKRVSSGWGGSGLSGGGFRRRRGVPTARFT